MINVKVNIDAQKLLNDATRFVAAKGASVADKIAFDIFRRERQNMLALFDTHSVTIEMKNGMASPYGARDKSGATNGYGNLYSYFGFDAGTNPITPLRQVIKSNTLLYPTIKRGSTWYYRVQIPSESDILDAAPLPSLNGVSWVEEVENGHNDNLQHYLNSRAKGRSGGGIQVEAVLASRSFTPVQYTSEIFYKFRQNILRG